MFVLKKYKILFLLFFCLVDRNASRAHAQIILNDTTDFHFWYSTFDARSIAMGNATVADPLNSNALYSNPGILPFNTSQPELGMHSTYNSRKNIFIENLTVMVAKSSDKKVLFGVTVIHNGPTQLPLADNLQLSFTQFSLDMAYGQMLTPSLSMGFRVNTDYGSTKFANLFTANTSVGVLYAPSSLVSYGLVFKGTGFQDERIGSGLSYFRTGQQEQTQIAATKLPQRLCIGATLRFPSLAEHPDFVLSFSNEKLFGERGLVYRGGLEVFLSNNFTLRSGYFHSSFIQGGQMGVGLLLNPIHINYAYSDNNLDLSGRTHLLSITVDI